MAVRRNDGRWQASVRLAGRRYTFYGATHAQAEAQAVEFRRRVRGNEGVQLADWMQQWMQSKELAPSTRASYERLWRCWLQPLGRMPLQALTVQDCQQQVDKAPHGSRRKTLAVLRAALNDAVRQGLLDGNPAQLVRVPAYEPAGKAMTRQQAQAMLAHTGRYEPLYRVALATGLRLGELLALTPQDVRNGVLYVRKSKTRAGVRAVPVPAATQPCLYAIASAEALFTTTKGTRPSPTHVRQRLYAACAAAGIPRYRFHDLRHSYATWALEAQIPLHVLSKLLGHSSIAVTADVYGHLQPAGVDVSALAL